MIKKSIFIFAAVGILFSCENKTQRELDTPDARAVKQNMVEQLYASVKYNDSLNEVFSKAGAVAELQKNIEDTKRLRSEISTYEKQGYDKEENYPAGKKTADLSKN